MKYGILGLVIVALGAGGLFYYYNTDKAEHEAVIRNIVEIREDITKSVARLDAEESKLNALNFALSSGGDPNKDIRSQYLRTRSIIFDTTDIFFTNATSSHPELVIKVKNKEVKESLNHQRAEINNVFELWSVQIDSATSVELRANLIVDSNRNIAIITSYIKDLGKVASTLTTQNSGLSASVIATYKADLAEAAQQISEVQTILLAVVVTSPTVAVSPSPSTQEAQLLAQIEAQQAVVAQAQAQAAALQAELARAEAVLAAQALSQAQASSSQQPSTTYVPVQSNPTVQVVGDPVNYNHVTIPDNFHPDEPQLLQGW